MVRKDIKKEKSNTYIYYKTHISYLIYRVFQAEIAILAENVP